MRYILECLINVMCKLVLSDELCFFGDELWLIGLYMGLFGK